MRITGAKVYTEKHIFEDIDICISGDRIAAVADAGETLDCAGLYAIPGLVDIHLHGAAGQDLCECDEEGLAAMAQYEAEHGVLAICPATMTYSEEKLTGIMRKVAGYVSGKDAAALAGINLEGPFISGNRLGAQNPAYLSEPDVEMFERLQKESTGMIKLLDIAPELPGSMELIEKLSGKVKISLAHTDADYETALRAFKSGAGHVTHLFNAMNGINHRLPGPIVAARECGAEVELIADGVHIHPAVVRLVFDIFGEDKVCLISDSMEATGLPDGEYSLGGQKVLVSGNRAILKDAPETVAGSVTNLFDCMKRAVTEMGIPLEKAVRAASGNPAAAIGIECDYGSISPGKFANIILMDENLNIRYIVNRGRVI